MAIGKVNVGGGKKSYISNLSFLKGDLGIYLGAAYDQVYYYNKTTGVITRTDQAKETVLDSKSGFPSGTNDAHRLGISEYDDGTLLFYACNLWDSSASNAGTVKVFILNKADLSTISIKSTKFDSTNWNTGTDAYLSKDNYIYVISGSYSSDSGTSRNNIITRISPRDTVIKKSSEVSLSTSVGIVYQSFFLDEDDEFIYLSHGHYLTGKPRLQKVNKNTLARTEISGFLDSAVRKEIKAGALINGVLYFIRDQKLYMIDVLTPALVSKKVVTGTWEIIYKNKNRLYVNVLGLQIELDLLNAEEIKRFELVLEKCVSIPSSMVIDKGCAFIQNDFTNAIEKIKY